MSKEKNRKSKKKNGGKIVLLLIIIIIAVAAILLFGKGGFGLGGGSGEGVPAGGTIPVMSDSPETVPDSTPAPESEQTTADGEDEEGQQGSRVIIEVAEDKIFADGSVCMDTAVLRDYLLGAAGEDTEFILRDNHAVKSVYDEAKGVLDELGYEYTGEVVE